MKLGISWAKRKASRTEYFQRFVYGWRTKECSACSGSGYYDDTGSPKCGACDGTGKEVYRGPKSYLVSLAAKDLGKPLGGRGLQGAEET
jgi:hypothetical protein